MKTLTLNDRLILTYPDRFQVLDEAERKKLNFIEEGPGEVLKDPEGHMIISIGFKAPGGLVSAILSVKDAARNMETSIQKAMQPYGYKKNESVTKDVGGEKAEGICYEYQAQDIEMYGETYVVKYDKAFYYPNYYTRKELKLENQKIWDEILASAAWL